MPSSKLQQADGDENGLAIYAANIVVIHIIVFGYEFNKVEKQPQALKYATFY